MKIVQVVGYQNSGKTTLVSRLIQHYSEVGWQVASLKHHGHEEENLFQEEKLKDTDQHRLSGSQLVGLSTAHQLELTLPSDKEWSLEAMIEIYENFKMFDILFIEGYKQAKYPKVVLLRNFEDAAILEQLSNVLLVIMWQDIEKLKPLVDVPIFNLKDSKDYTKALIDYIGELNA